MSTQGYAFFDTAIGRCGIVWGERGVLGVQLPAASEASAQARLRRKFPNARETTPPDEVARAIDAMTALLGGEARDLASIAIDMSRVPEIDRTVFSVARGIAPGTTTVTYGEIATRLGDPRAAPEVGQALARNPFPLLVPCHRVLAAGGKIGGFSAPGGAATKRRLLAIESWMSPAATLFNAGAR